MTRSGTGILCLGLTVAVSACPRSASAPGPLADAGLFDSGLTQDAGRQDSGLGKDAGDGGGSDSGATPFWLRGAIISEDFSPTWSFAYLQSKIPEFQDIGITTIETLPIWKPCASPPPFDLSMRWGVQDYTVLDPHRGTDSDLAALLADAHDAGIGLISMIETENSVVPTANSCGGDAGLVAPGTPDYYDGDGDGGYYYQLQVANPSKVILLRDNANRYACTGQGWGFSLATDSPDLISLYEQFYQQQVIDRGLDGLRIDSDFDNNCPAGDQVYYSNATSRACTPIACIDPVPTQHSLFPLLSALWALKSPEQFFLSEYQTSEALTNWYGCTFPYYTSNPDLDQVSDAMEGYELAQVLGDIFGGLSSAQFAAWVNNQPGPEHVRMIRNWNGVSCGAYAFVASDPRYDVSVALVCALPGVPEVSNYELYGDSVLPSSCDAGSANPAASRLTQWRTLLQIRNASNALLSGSLTDVWKAGSPTIAFRRSLGTEHMVTVLNFTDEDATTTLDLSAIAGLSTLTDVVTDETFSVPDAGNAVVSVPAYGWRLLRP
jgi:hypothetical protein